MVDLATRIRDDELMDQPGLPVSQHDRALAGLQRVNTWSRTASRIWTALHSLAIRRNLTQLRLLDLACGGGDVCVKLAQLADANGVCVDIQGWDRSRTAVEFATRAAARKQLRSVSFFERDVLNDPISGEFDAVISTLFFHHLEAADAVRLLRKMSASAKHAVLVDDLRRTKLGYWLARWGTRLLSRSPVVHFDGPISVRSAFTCAEFRALAAEAGLDKLDIETHWPQRFLARWERP